MKPVNLKNKYKQVSVTCGCGASFTIKSFFPKDQLKLDICNKCHGFYTGKSKILDTEGRVQAFKRRFNR